MMRVPAAATYISPYAARLMLPPLLLFDVAAARYMARSYAIEICARRAQNRRTARSRAEECALEARCWR